MSVVGSPSDRARPKLPHGVIGIAFAVAGSNEPSVEYYREWGSEWAGSLTLIRSSLILLAHFALSVLGFAVSGVDLWRRRRSPASAEQGRSA